MTFSIIGTGNIAWFLGNRLVAGHHRCTGVYGRNADKARELAGALLSDKYGEISDFRDGDADICFLTVSDAAIAGVSLQLRLKETVLVHTAGAVGLDAIDAAAQDRAVLWPVYSITKNNLPVHRNVPCAWEASSPRAARFVQSAAHAVTDQYFEAKYEQRKWLHLSAVIGNNFVNHLMAICEQICKENKLEFSVLTPILEQTFERIKHISPHAAQTGPAIRRDTTTIQGQMLLLGSHPQWQRIYEAMTASIQANDFNNFS